MTPRQRGATNERAASKARVIHVMANASWPRRLAAIRVRFHWLVVGQVVAIAHAVRGPKHVDKRGKPPVLTADQARELLDSIDVSTVVGLRDRARIALMAYSFARVSAAVAMRVEDYFATGKRWWVRLHEKGWWPRGEVVGQDERRGVGG